MIWSYGGSVADDEASGFDAGADGHFGAFDVDQALESGVSGLRVRKVFSFEDQLARHSAGDQDVLFV